MLVPLPVDAYVSPIREELRTRRAAILVAAPGAGKTTRVPPALADDGPVILLQPRRVAARAIARRIADERHWTVGREVGWHVRFERRFSDETRLLVATEGILTARLQQDPLLSGFQTIILDEFHERSIHADLGLALAKQAFLARNDLGILVMSATLDAGRVAEYLDDCRVFDVPGSTHPVSVRYAPATPVHDAVAQAVATTRGHVLCFLPGAGEVRRSAAAIRQVCGSGLEVVELHGSLAGDEQEEALAESRGRRVIVATNIAETSLTVPGVFAVVDSGLHKVARYDPDRGVDSLELERISRDAADQRAGRAGRLGPGAVLRLWHEADRLRPHREPDISRVDLAGPVLDLLAWGADPRAFPWFEPPPEGALDAALEMLQRLGAAEGSRLSALGHEMSRLPLHPRLARILLAARGAWQAALACALLSERTFQAPHPPTTSCDLLVASERDLPEHVVRHAKELQRIFGARDAACSETDLRRALLAGYPDRVARRRSPEDPRAVLFSGHGAVVGPESGVRAGDFLLALDVQAGRRGEQSEARIRAASAVDREWLTRTHVDSVVNVDDAGVVRAFQREMYGALVIRERVMSPEPAAAACHLADALLARPLSADDGQLVRRLRFAGIPFDLPEVARRAASGCRRLDDVRLDAGLEWNERQQLASAAPAALTAPSGRTHALHYRDDGTVALSIKLQELFGLASTPRIGPKQMPVVILLLAPNGRPVQTTTDLESFWKTTYQEVRKELRGRYPKHPWPENPWSATPTGRTLKKRTSS